MCVCVCLGAMLDVEDMESGFQEQLESGISVSAHGKVWSTLRSP